MRINFCSFVVEIVTYIAVALQKYLCAFVEFIVKQSIEHNSLGEFIFTKIIQFYLVIKGIKLE